MGPFPKMVNSVNLKSFTILVKRSRFTARKITFSFPRRLKKMLFPKKRLSCIIGKDVLSEKIIFLFPENMILPLRRKWEMIFLKRSFSSNILKRWSFQSKGIALGYDLSCIIWKDGIFFPKTWYFFPGRKMRGDPSQEIHGNMIFSVYTYRRYKRDATLPCLKKSKMILSRKSTPKGDWHSRLTF